MFSVLYHKVKWKLKFLLKMSLQVEVHFQVLFKGYKMFESILGFFIIWIVKREKNHKFSSFKVLNCILEREGKK
jgi:uncharacterized membrane protein